MIEQTEVKEILLDLLKKGLLRIRQQGWSGAGDQCAIEADHLHNLPSLILKPTPEELVYYFDVSRVDFIRHAVNASEFEADWQRLEPIIQEMRGKPN